MEASRTFRQLFGHAPDVVAEANGRANLIGEHTDHSGGYVLPLPLPLATRIELRLRADREVRIHSVQMGETARFVLGAVAEIAGWSRYVWAATQAAAPRSISGFDARLDSTVPLGAGLASSAALLVALLRALRTAFEWTLSDAHLALLAYRAETELVGVPVGMMDPLVASLGQLGSALFLDTASLETEQLALPPTFGLAVLHSGVEHHLDRDAYGLRRRECEAAARALGVHALGALTIEDLPRTAALGSPLDHRARHVLTENTRVLEARTALLAGDLPRLGVLFDASHRSLRDDFQVSTPEVDTLVDLARNAPGILGARMTGGGFGGAIIALGPPAGLRQAMEAVASDYRRLVGRPGRVLLPE